MSRPSLLTVPALLASLLTPGVAALQTLSQTQLLPVAAPTGAGQATVVRAFGFDAATLGDASLGSGQTADGQAALVVSNLGSSGMDGVSIAPQGTSDGELLAVRLEATETDLGVQAITCAARGTVGGSPDQALGSARFQRGEDPVLTGIWSLTLDGSALGASGHTLEFFDEGWPVGSLALADGDALVLADGPRTVRYDASLGGWSLVFDEPLSVHGVQTAVGFQPLALGASRIHCTPDTPQGAVAVTRLDVTASDVESLLVSGLAAGFDGALVSGLDQTLITTSAGKLKVNNLGSSGMDGVSIAPPGDDGVHAEGLGLALDPLSDGSLQSGSVSFSSVARVQGERHASFAGATLTRVAPGTPDLLAFSCDPDMLQVWWDYELSLAGQVVTSGDPAGVQFFAVDRALELLTGVHCGSGAQGAALALQFAAPVVVFIDGAVHQADAIQLSLPASEAWRVSALEALTVQGAGLAEIALSRVTASPMPAANIGHKYAHRGHVTVLKGPLALGGSMEAGAVSAVMLDDAPASEPGAVLLSLDVNPLAFKGGSLATLPIVTLLNVATDATGGIDLPFVWPTGLPGGLDFYAQVVVNETANQNFWLSNALRITVP